MFVTALSQLRRKKFKNMQKKLKILSCRIGFFIQLVALPPCLVPKRFSLLQKGKGFEKFALFCSKLHTIYTQLYD